MELNKERCNNRPSSENAFDLKASRKLMANSRWRYRRRHQQHHAVFRAIVSISVEVLFFTVRLKSPLKFRRYSKKRVYSFRNPLNRPCVSRLYTLSATLRIISMIRLRINCADILFLQLCNVLNCQIKRPKGSHSYYCFE